MSISTRADRLVSIMAVSSATGRRSTGRARSRAVPVWLRHALFIAALIGLWELAAGQGLLDPAFFGRPSGIAAYLWKGFVVDGTLWRELGYTLAGAVIALLLIGPLGGLVSIRYAVRIEPLKALGLSS